MAIEEPVPCAHTACFCRISPPETVCSEFCKIESDAQSGCGCGHTHCDRTNMTFVDHNPPIGLGYKGTTGAASI